MGVQGLLPVLKSISSRVHVSSYRGQKVAVDAYSWLHKGAYCCSQELCEGIPTDKYVYYCMSRVNLLQAAGVTPVIVFDGGRLPMKREEETARARSRQDNRDKAAAHMQAGNAAAAYECYQRAVDITPVAAKRFVDALKAAGVEFIVAPYEADAQLAYLAINGKVHAVITEDSDLLAYGCPRVLFKMDKAGDGQEIVLADLGRNRDLSFIGFTPRMFLEMCILSGCDFLKALPGIGVRKAHQHMRKLRTFIKVCKSLRFCTSTSVPPGYEVAFQRAIWTFQHQRVYSPDRRAMVHLTELMGGTLQTEVAAALPGPEEQGLDFLGPLLPDALAQAIAEGEVDPSTLSPFVPQLSGGMPSASSSGCTPHAPCPVNRKPFALQTNSITNYFTKQTPASVAARREFAPPRITREPPAGTFQPKPKPHLPPAVMASLHQQGYSSQPESSRLATGPQAACDAEEQAPLVELRSGSQPDLGFPASLAGSGAPPASCNRSLAIASVAHSCPLRVNQARAAAVAPCSGPSSPPEAHPAAASIPPVAAAAPQLEWYTLASSSEEAGGVHRAGGRSPGSTARCARHLSSCLPGLKEGQEDGEEEDPSPVRLHPMALLSGFGATNSLRVGVAGAATAAGQPGSKSAPLHQPLKKARLQARSSPHASTPAVLREVLEDTTNICRSGPQPQAVLLDHDAPEGEQGGGVVEEQLAELEAARRVAGVHTEWQEAMVPAFNSMQHAEQFAQLATQALDRVQGQIALRDVLQHSPPKEAASLHATKQLTPPGQPGLHGAGGSFRPCSSASMSSACRQVSAAKACSMFQKFAFKGASTK